MKKIPNEIKVALLVLVALFFLYFGFNFLKGSKVLSSEKEYTVIYDDVKGLIAGNPIKVSGLKVGMVKEAEIIQDGTNRVKITMAVDDEIKIPKGAKAEIVSAGLLGDMEIALDYSGADLTDLAKDGDELQGSLRASMMDSFSGISGKAEPIANRSEKLLASLDSVTAMLNGILAEGTIQNSLASIEKTTATLDQTTKSLNSLVATEKQNIKNIIQNTQNLVSTLNTSTAQLDQIMANANQFSQNLADTDIKGKSETLFADLEKTLTEANTTFKQLNETIANVNSTDGSLGLLIHDSKLYDNLNATSRDLDKLLVDLKENPKKYVQFSLIERKDKSEKKNKKNKEQN